MHEKHPLHIPVPAVKGSRYQQQHISDVHQKLNGELKRDHGACLTSSLWDVYQRFGGAVPNSEFGTTPPGTTIPPGGGVSRQAQVRWCRTIARTKAESCVMTAHVLLHRCGTCIRGLGALSQILNLGQHPRGPPYPLGGVYLVKHRSDRCRTIARTKAESCVMTAHGLLHRCGTCIRGLGALSQILNLGHHPRGPPYPRGGVYLGKHRSVGAKR